MFLIYINDIPTSISFSSMYLFADDGKILNEDPTCLQNDLDSITDWSADWKIQLNAIKSSHVHFSIKGQSSTTNYKVNESIIGLSSSYKQLWRPHLAKDITNLERVQRRATKFILQNKSLDYKERLVSLLLLPINMWLELQDLLFLVKCLKDPPDNFDILQYVSFCKAKCLKDPPDNFDILQYVSFCKANTRSSAKGKMEYHYKRTSLGRHYYFNRVVRLWNALPEIELEASARLIKIQISKFLWNHFITNFDPDSHCTYHHVPTVLVFISSCTKSGISLST